MSAPEQEQTAVNGVPHPGLAYHRFGPALDAGGVPVGEVRLGRCHRCAIVWLWAGRPLRKLGQPRRCLMCGDELRATTTQANPRQWRWHPGSEADREWRAWVARLSGSKGGPR